MAGADLSHSFYENLTYSSGLYEASEELYLIFILTLLYEDDKGGKGNSRKGTVRGWMALKDAR